jgi:septum formation protein
VNIVLASASPRRAQILRDAGIPFTVQPTETDETQKRGEGVQEMVRRLAEAKARAAAAARRETEAAIVIGADTAVDIDGSVLGKPLSADAAREMLRRLGGQTHTVWTAVALLSLPDNSLRRGLERTEVRFAPLTEAEIDAYVCSGEPLDKAGAYGIQGVGGRFVEAIEGCYFNVVGLPLARTYRMLREMGWKPAGE